MFYVRTFVIKSTILSLSIAFYLLAQTSLASAHGAPEYPISRQYNCYKHQGQALSECVAAIAFGGAQAIYDWNGVNQAAAAGNHRAVVPDGKLCAGGQEKFKGFDLARSDWDATPWSPNASGRYEFRYYATAPHRTLSWQFYLTRNGWNPATAPLKWSDLDLVAEVSGSQVVTTADSRYVMQLNLPVRTGRHLLYAVWQRSDSTEAFYSCSDVTFGGTTGVPPTPTGFQQLGQIAASDLPIGTTVKFRVFDRNGADVEAHNLTIQNGDQPASEWLSDLATMVNQASRSVRIGQLQGGTVVVPVGKTILQVYALTADSGLRYVLDTTFPPNTNPPPPSGTIWTEGKTYTRGGIVVHLGKRYICLQTHTAWVGAGWQPNAAGTVNVLWKPI
jgi:chitin-binding protein